MDNGGQKVFIERVDRRLSNETLSSDRNDVTEHFLDGVVRYAKAYCDANGCDTMVLRNKETGDVGVEVFSPANKMPVQGLVPNYKLSDDEVRIIEEFVKFTGFGLSHGTEIVDAKSFITVMEKNLKIFDDWCIEASRHAQYSLRTLPGYIELALK